MRKMKLKKVKELAKVHERETFDDIYNFFFFFFYRIETFLIWKQMNEPCTLYKCVFYLLIMNR